MPRSPPSMAMTFRITSSTPGIDRRVCSAARSAGCSQVAAAISGKRWRERGAGTLEVMNPSRLEVRTLRVTRVAVSEWDVPSRAGPHRLIQVSQEIFRVLDAAAQANEAVGQAHGLTHGGWDRGVGHRSWVPDQALDAAE